MSLRRELLGWYRRVRRDLPWRRTRDPYRIWLSETMLQQTRVDTVIPYYERFLERFPNVRALAEAELDDVMQEWAGLGYYSRARNLWRAANMVCTRFEGRMPDEASILQELPGVGRYTAGAVASIAFDRCEPVVDGNVARVLSRLHALDLDVKSGPGSRWLWAEAGRVVAGPQPGELNQALMELGATLCTPTAPACDRCPVRAHCEAAERGDPESFPVLPKRRAARPARAVAALVLRRGRALAVRRPPHGLLGGLWELPSAEVASDAEAKRELAGLLQARVGLEIGSPRPLGRVEHVFTHRRLTLDLFRADVLGGRVRLDGFDAHRWMTPSALRDLPASRLTAKVLDLALAPEARTP